MQIMNNRTISVVTDDKINVLFVKNGVEKESVIPNLRTLYKNQLWPELTCIPPQCHQIFKRKSTSLLQQFRIYHPVYQNLRITHKQ